MQVSDPRAKHWLADDANFLATLGDLDRGLGGLDPGLESPPLPPRSAPVSSETAASRTSARVIDAARALSAAAPLPSSAAPVESRPRPLLDLFPEWALLPESAGPPASPAPSESAAAAAADDAPRRPRPPMASLRPEPAVLPQLQALTGETFYGLPEKPFSLSTDPRFEYASASHARAREGLLAAIHARGGPIVLTAPFGMGKTTLCRALVQGIDRRIVTSLVLEPVQSFDELLKTMLVDFGVMAREDLAGAPHLTRALLASTLNTFLESLGPLKAAAVVLIDEAQNVPVDLLADLGAALAPGTPGAGVLRLVLVGQPSLTKRLKHPDLRGLNASIGQRLTLGPLSADEVSGYVSHRLSVAGGQGRLAFDDTACGVLFQLSAGVPRTVNLLCDRAMTLGQQASTDLIDGALIEAAASDLDLQPAAEGPGPLGRVLIAAVFALLVLVGAAGALWASRDAVERTIRQWEQVPLPPGGPARQLSVPLAPIPPPELIPDNLPRRPAI